MGLNHPLNSFVIGMYIFVDENNESHFSIKILNLNYDNTPLHRFFQLNIYSEYKI